MSEPHEYQKLFIRSIFDSGVGRWNGYGYTKEESIFAPTMLETGTKFRAEFTLDEITTQDRIRQTMDDIKEMLLEKNRSYGDSAINPVRIFSQASREEQLLVRIDDKLSRFARGHDYMGDDDIDDLIGYLVLLKIARKTL